MNGRCFVPGTDHLTAMNIYNGRLLWQRELPGFAHWPAAYRGPSLAVDRTCVYAVQGLRCLLLDPATGSTRGEYAPPVDALGPKQSDRIVWEYLAIIDDLIVGTLGEPRIKREWWSKAYPVNHVLFALDRRTGACRWVHKSEQGIDSNAIAIDDGSVFLIDGRPRYPFLVRRRGKTDRSAARRTLRSLALATGDVLWETDDVAPTLNSLWTDDGIIVATTAPHARTMVDKNAAAAGGGITAYAARDGSKRWRIEKSETLAPFIAGGVLYTPKAYDLRTGEPVPARAGGGQFSAGLKLLCSTLAACPALAMARQSSLGFRDLLKQSGTYQYPIVRASCWINMIPAGGLIVVPEGGSSCMCAYNYKTSLALMSDDRHFHYGLGGSGLPGRPALRVNFGAPGDRPDAAGQMWRAYPRPVAYGRCLGSQPYGPKVAGPRLPIEERGNPASYRTVGRHPDWVAIANTDQPWLFSCGLEGPVHVTVRLPPELRKASHCRVTLYFCELEEGEVPRVFDVKVQGRIVLSRWNLTKAAGGQRRAIVKEFTLETARTVTLELAAENSQSLPPVISGLVIAREEGNGDR